MKRWPVLFLIAATGLIIMLFIDYQYRQQIDKRNTDALAEEMKEFQKSLLSTIRLHLAAVENLKAFMLATPTLPNNQTFDRFAAELVVTYPTIKTVQYVDTDRIIRYIYPLAGNEPVLNLDLTTHPAAPFIEKAIRQRQITITNPTLTFQGSLAIIARTPLYQQNTFLGLVQGIFDIDQILKDVEPQLPPSYKFQLYDADKIQFWGAEAITEKTQTSNISVGDSTWTLILGWDTPPFQPDTLTLLLIWGGGTLLLLSVLFIVNQTWLNTERLTSAVDHNISARKRVEENLRESETRFQLAVQAANVGLWDWNIQKNIVHYSPEWKRQIGYDDDEITTAFSEWEDRVHPDDIERMRKTITAYLKKPWPNYEEEFRLRHKDGSYLWILTTASLFHDENGQPVRMLGGHIDITRKKEIEHALQASELLLRETSKIAMVGGWEFDAATLQGQWTEMVTSIHEIDPNYPASVEYALTFFPEESRQLVENAVKNAIERGEPYDLEVEFISSKGNHKWIRTIATPIWENNKVVKIRGVLQDISTRKQAELLRQRYADRLEALYQIAQTILSAQSPEEIGQAALIHLEGLIAYQQATINLFNLKNNEAVVIAEYPAYQEHSQQGKYLPLTLSANDLDILRQGNTLITTHSEATDTRLNAPLLFQNEILGTLTIWPSTLDTSNEENQQIVQEVANQLAIAIQNAQLTNRFRRVITSISDCIYMTEMTASGHSTNQYVSPQIHQLTGYSEQTYLTDWRFWIDNVIHPDDRADAAVQWAKLTRGQDSETEYRIIRADGDVVWVRDNARAESMADGSKLIYGVVSNITERKRLEEQLYQAQKMEAIGRLAGGIAHDFNNILTVITGFGELILQNRLNKDDPMRQDVEQIVKAGHRAATLTQQLLAYSRKQMLQPRIINLNHTIEHMSKMLKRLLGEDINLVTQFYPNLGTVKIDPGQIDQVLVNLAINARDAMPQGGQLTIETANAELDETYAHTHIDVTPGHYIMLSVSDSGHGMDSATQSQAFEPFFTTKDRGQGTGLGLAMVQGIIKQSGGHIWLYSELGQGTIFKIYLPRIDASSPVQTYPSSAFETTDGSETILLIEDEAMVKDFTYRILTDKGYTVLTASNGREALTIVDQYNQTIDLLITDVILPEGMNGVQTATILVKQYPKLKVLYISGYTDNVIIHYGVLDSGLFFLEKPFTPKALLLKIRELLNEGDS
ncbi:MAG: PAS domain-containing protein [Anaerolineae bacterium]|nr:PAS domain-containing protein [Anaerolineae bacterium]